MGYFVSIEDSDFLIREENCEAAYQALVANGLQTPLDNHHAWVSPSILVDALSAYGFEVEDRSPAGVRIRWFNGKTNDEHSVVLALAPYVAEESFLEWRGEDGSMWRDVVRGSKLYSEKVQWVPDGCAPETPAPLHTTIPVMYRDGANYKAHGTIQLQGAITPTQIAAIRALLDEGVYYAPRALGMPHLGEREWGSLRYDDDHEWHEMFLDDLELSAGDTPARWGHSHVAGKVSEFVENLTQAASLGWKVGGGQ
ncbi:hypothetical protein [Mycobacteroides abscessus]|uniref:hypothetical protein n=1 Tax=Mycobacteroides abscessus TaxID=36809 RepID=UPI0009A5AFBE|nr:hypothetical protein [Mycobacteroides abscessus]SLH40576.1 Uncharacterised protein [Mycobacteroides abscessus subsp. massiliense]